LETFANAVLPRLIRDEIDEVRLSKVAVVVGLFLDRIVEVEPRFSSQWRVS